MKQTTLNYLTAITGTIATYSFGAWSELFGFFLLALAVDYGTGIAASIYEGTGLNSRKGLFGLTRKFLMIVVVVLSHRLDILMGTDVVMSGAIYFYLANEFISIAENYGRLGLPLPNRFKQIISVLKQKGDS